MNSISITGTNAITSIGQNLRETWEGLLNGSSGAEKVTRFKIDSFQNQRACEIKKLIKQRTPSRTVNLLLDCIEGALKSANLNLPLENKVVGLCIGTTMGEIEPFEKNLIHGLNELPAGPDMIGQALYEILGLNGPLWTFTNACAAGNFAIAKAMDEVEDDEVDIMIACGVDVLSQVAFTGFSSLRAMSPDVCSPFNSGRKGLLLGEGAGAIIIEKTKDTVERNQKPLASLCAYGFSSDGHHITQPDPEAKGAIRAIQQALLVAKLSPKDIGYVSAHGTGTLANDYMETKALNEVFPRNCEYHVSSIKGHIGHTLGAASVIEAVISVQALISGILPQNLNLQEIDPLCNLPLIKDTPLKKNINYVLSNSYAFGGVNSSIILGKVR
ncbi:beta-ketoacyl-[acyl-carrier-protein] synthase family protein [Fictibacillus enclensis]|uniref:beta-ketoacyl-[acyl-carrier-protein] synthase family protein n=1 Tax=Fictibacillus enclensis TaxID=1017270 RepID=UPI0025A09187|nr:beta-ketoacyl-[acyl-carrier-protein] synthase family protein [Fictibacillus enclensis]MDM5335836.1 beta-ketoacyl-[acyl-carrier-protein] synthase family protein [Fictibacillus enclensis]